MFEDLNESNFTLYAAKAYDTPNCIKSEFAEDINRVRYIRRMFRTYRKTGELKERNLVNHLVVTYNVFGPAATRMLFYMVDKENHVLLKTFLLFIGRMPERIAKVRGEEIISSDIGIDLKIVELLRKL
jgi:hypothetical protein